MILTLSMLVAPAHAGPTEPMDEKAVASEIAASLKIENKVTLVDAGKGKKRVLKFAPKPGAEARTNVITEQSMEGSMVIAGSTMKLPMPDSMPVTTIGTLTTVGEPNAKGMIPVTVQYEDITVDGKGPAAQASKDALSKLQGTSFDLLMKDGAILQVDVQSDDPAMYELMQGMADQFSNKLATFPKEPVGVGAIYTIDTNMSMMGMEFDLAQTVTVSAIQGTNVTMDSTFVMSLGDSKFQLPGLPPGAKLDMKKFEGTGTGQTIVDLTTLSSTGNAKMDMEFAMDMNIEGQDVSMTMAMEQETKMVKAK